MSKNYNSNLQTNNTDLQAILNTINELPEAGGASVETCEVTITNSNSAFWCFMYNNEDGAVYQTEPLATGKSATITIRKNSALVILCTNFLPSITCSSEIVYLGDGGITSHIKTFTFSVNGDGSITVRDDD